MTGLEPWGGGFEHLLEDDGSELKLVPDPDARQGMGNLSAAIVEEETAYFSSDALHAKSPPERGVRWVEDGDSVPEGKTYWIAWITLGRNEQGQRCFKGVVTSPMTIDRDAMVGHKVLGEHVNDMRQAIEGQVQVENLTDGARAALRRLLSWEEELWEHSSPELKAALGDDPEDP